MARKDRSVRGWIALGEGSVAIRTDIGTWNLCSDFIGVNLVIPVFSFQSDNLEHTASAQGRRA